MCCTSFAAVSVMRMLAENSPKKIKIKKETEEFYLDFNSTISLELAGWGGAVCVYGRGCTVEVTTPKVQSSHQGIMQGSLCSLKQHPWGTMKGPEAEPRLPGADTETLGTPLSRTCHPPQLPNSILLCFFSTTSKASQKEANCIQIPFSFTQPKLSQLHPHLLCSPWPVWFKIKVYKTEAE